MKTDHEVLLMRRERAKGKTQVHAAARAGMSERTARKYEQAAALPSQLQQPRIHRTRAKRFRRSTAGGKKATKATTGGRSRRKKTMKRV